VRAVVFEGEGRLSLKDVPRPEIESGDQVLLRVEAAAICGTDVHIVSVPPGFVATPNTILGHEGVGTVVDKGGEVGHLEVGDRVVVNPNDYCGVCRYCRQNLPNKCENRVAMGIHADGVFAEYSRVSGKLAYRISRDVPLEHAACAEPLACAISGARKVGVQPGETTVVIGAGPIGLMMAMMFGAAGAGRIVIAEKSPCRVAHARQMDIGRVVDVNTESLREVVAEEMGGGADVVADMVCSQLGVAVDLAAIAGRVLLFGVDQKATASFRQFDVNFKELRILGTSLASGTFPAAVGLLESGVLDIGSLITDAIPLSDIHQGIDRLSRGEAIKVIVRP